MIFMRMVLRTPDLRSQVISLFIRSGPARTAFWQVVSCKDCSGESRSWPAPRHSPLKSVSLVSAAAPVTKAIETIAVRRMRRIIMVECSLLTAGFPRHPGFDHLDLRRMKAHHVGAEARRQLAEAIA